MVCVRHIKRVVISERCVDESFDVAICCYTRSDGLNRSNRHTFTQPDAKWSMKTCWRVSPSLAVEEPFIGRSRNLFGAPVFGNMA